MNTDQVNDLGKAPTEPSEAGSVQRIGRFLVQHGMLQEWHQLLPVMGQMVVVRAESKYDLDAIEYIALCEQFDEVAVGEAAPDYQAIVTRSEDGQITVKWERTRDWRRETPNAKISERE